MRLDSARELKAMLTRSVVEPFSASEVTRSTLGVPAQPMSALGFHTRTKALSVGRKGRGDYTR